VGLLTEVTRPVVWLGVAVVVVAAACSSHGPIRTLTVAPDQAAELTVIRPSRHLQGAGNTWVVAIDEHAVLGIRIGEHATITVPAGDRIITSDCVTAFPVVRPGAPLRVTVRAGGHHYVTLGACALAEVTETTAVGLMSETRRIGP
jgi:hypothetical protein